jgi:uncharacterized protein YggE
MSLRAGLALIACCVSSAALAQAAPEPERTVVVVGRGEVRKPGDFANISARLSGQAPDTAAALSALTQTRQRVEAAVRRLDGVTSVQISSGPLSVQQPVNTGCGGEARSMLGGALCTPATAAVQLSVRVRPAERAGDVAAVAAQQGALNANVQGGGLDRPEELEREALRAALSNARSQATAIADALSGSLGAVLRVQDLSSTNAGLAAFAAAITPTAPTTAPPTQGGAVAVDDFTPAPVARTSLLAVVFAFKPGPPGR